MPCAAPAARPGGQSRSAGKGGHPALPANILISSVTLRPTHNVRLVAHTSSWHVAVEAGPARVIVRKLRCINGSPSPRIILPRRACRVARDDKEARLAKALRSIARERHSLRAAARTWGISFSTLQERSKRPADAPTARGRPPSLPPALEDKLVSGVLRLADIGFALNTQQICHLAKEVMSRVDVYAGRWNAGKDCFVGIQRW